VVLGDPIPHVAERLDMPGEIDRVAQRVATDRAFRDRRLVEDTQRKWHEFILPAGPMAAGELQRFAPYVGACSHHG
jgi:hypothetical protein